MAARELVSTRTFPHAPAALFAAFADPARLARWWGPAGATNEFHEFDLRPGGRWRFTMRMADGSTFPMDKTFLKVDPPRRIVVQHLQAGHDHTLAMAYVAVGVVPQNDAEKARPAGRAGLPDGTRLTWRARFATAEQLAAVEKPFAEGNEQNFDRLAAEMKR